MTTKITFHVAHTESLKVIMNASIASNQYRQRGNDLFRLFIFCLISIFIHAIGIHLITLPKNVHSINNDKLLPVTIFKSKPSPVQKKEINSVPDKKITPKTTVNSTPAKKTVLFKQQKVKRSATKQISPAIKPKAENLKTSTLKKKTTKTEVVEIKKVPQPLNSLKLRSDSLRLIPELITSLIKEGKSAEDDFVIFDPRLQQKINQARHERLQQQNFQLDELDLTVEDKNPDLGNYRETIVDGNCWLIPIDNSFEPLEIRIVVASSNCNPPKNKLSNLIKNLKPLN